jgi:porphobilinogen deaminase
MLPCVNQGILVVQCKKDDHELCELIKERLVCANTFDVWRAERAVLEATNADCKKAIAIFASLDGGQVSLTTRAFSGDGVKMVEVLGRAPRSHVDSMGREVGLRLLDQIQTEKIW